ncbi:SDR family oxidoreductase [Streptomyces sp. H021]|uniref:SDR family oxidoreductase n=1 Tax=Streptomyces sp. H021 TaxID=1519486 RepID=UPI00099B2C9B|nr:SDR family oxidoreductase [Streptomyces sp. H021]
MAAGAADQSKDRACGYGCRGGAAIVLGCEGHRSGSRTSAKNAPPPTPTAAGRATPRHGQPARRPGLRGAARYVVADITDEAQVERAVDAAVADIGRLGIAVNDAGYDGEYQLTRDYSADMLDRMIALNVRGGCCR